MLEIRHAVIVDVADVASVDIAAPCAVDLLLFGSAAVSVRSAGPMIR